MKQMYKCIFSLERLQTDDFYPSHQNSRKFYSIDILTHLIIYLTNVRNI